MYFYNLGVRFNQIAKKYPDNTALRFSKTDHISYATLNKTANQLARFLLDIGVKQTDVVCISGIKTLPSFACMIACLKIGAAYTILDPDSPIERLRKIIERCMPKIFFAGSELRQSLKEVTENSNIYEIINEADKLENKISVYESSNLNETFAVTGSNPAYIMFTSGSTGFPKGAVMTHANVLNLIDWSVEAFNITPEDIFTNVNPIYFDNSVFDFYSSLFSGASMVPFVKETITDARLLINQIDGLGCTQWFSVPSLLIFLQTMRAVTKNNLRNINRILFGGEGYPKAKLKQLYDLYSDRIEFFNVYGPTECTCICSSYRITDIDFEDLNGFPPLGCLINNFSYLILDDNNKKTPNNEYGELCLLGPNVGKGYYNDRERTKTSFIQNPYNCNYEEIMYKTGDVVKYNSFDGKLYIGGRKDNQIKHMGYRIELEEIETALSQLNYISQAAVLHGSSRGFSQIVGVVSTQSTIKENILRNDLRQIIPDYMIPNTFYIANDLPKNSNGKVDRKRLAEIYL